MRLTRHVFCHIFWEINPSTLHNDMIFVLHNFFCNTPRFFRDHLAGQVGILWKGMWRYFCLRPWVQAAMPLVARHPLIQSPNRMTFWCCGDIAWQRCGDVAMDNMPESNSNQPEAHSTNITVTYAAWPYVRCIPVWRALLHTLAVGRIPTTLGVETCHEEANVKVIPPCWESHNPKVFPKRNDNRHIWQQGLAHVLLRYGNVH